jgi:anion-transporting  ArsA/GET3 family ATPase
MEPHHFFTAQRVLIVAGKGGVGKSAVSGALALLSAESGLRTLLVTLDAETIEVPAHDLLERIVVTPGRALTDYLSSKGMGLLSRQLSRSGIVELVATTAPGLDDLLVLGRIKAFEKELRADVIIVDGPAAGHASDLVRAPLQLKKAISSGPIGQQADEVITMLSDGSRCKVMMVTTPAITPVTETAEVANDMVETIGVVLAPTVVNKCDAYVAPVTSPIADTVLADAYVYATQRYASQRTAIELLSTLRQEQQLHLLRHREDGAALVALLANELRTAFGDVK